MTLILLAMSLQVTAAPRMSVSLPGHPTSVRVAARLVGVEEEKFYCPEVAFIYWDGLESVEQEDCPPFEERGEEPFRREWWRWFTVGPGSYEVAVSLRRHVEGERLGDHSRCKVLIRGATFFEVH